MVAKIMGFSTFLNMTLSMMGCLLFNSGTTHVWNLLLSIYFVSLIYSSVSIILAVTCIFMLPKMGKLYYFILMHCSGKEIW
jgi:hypothetical protein